MNKLSLHNVEQDKRVITFTINKQIKEKLNHVLANSEKYNLKRKSDWINEAIVMLKSNPDYKEIVCSAEGNNEDFVFDKIYMTFEQRCYFAEMRNDVVKAFPDIKGPQGTIIRTAVLGRLLRKM